MTSCFEGESLPKVFGGVNPKIKKIFFKGNEDLLSTEKIRLAVVGSRKMSVYGEMIIEKWIPEIVNAGIVIVSGFMYGVDQKAHLECLRNGGETIAVLGWGIDKDLEGKDKKLMENILGNHGLVLSEYERQTRATSWTFPQRNRIVAGIVDAVWVVEADLDSGSLITADLAIKMKKKLLALPGRVDVAVSRGTNWLIATGRAKCVLSAKDVLKELGVGGAAKSENIDLDEIEKCLENGGLTADELGRKMGWNVDEVMAEMQTKILLGKVEERLGKYWLV